MTTEVTVALITAASVGVPALLASLAAWRETARKVEKVHAEVKTNQGKRQGEHIEFLVGEATKAAAERERLGFQIASLTELWASQMMVNETRHSKNEGHLEKIQGRIEKIERETETARDAFYEVRDKLANLDGRMEDYVERGRNAYALVREHVGLPPAEGEDL